MFKIRSSQIEAFDSAQLLQFQQRLYQHLQKYFPEAWPADIPGREALFRQGMQDARRFRLQREANIVVYFNIMMSLGPAFADEQPWAGPILRDTGLHENEKLRRLIRHTEELLDHQKKPAS